MRVAANQYRSAQRSPCGTWKCPLHRLQLAEQMAEMFAVLAAAAALLHPAAFGQNQRCFAHDVRNRDEPLRMQRRRIDGDAPLDQSALALVDREHLAGV